MDPMSQVLCQAFEFYLNLTVTFWEPFMVPILQSRKLRYEELKQLVKAFFAIKVPLDNRVRL